MLKTDQYQRVLNSESRKVTELYKMWLLNIVNKINIFKLLTFQDDIRRHQYKYFCGFIFV